MLFLSGQPRRNLLTTGWSVFVSSKRLVAGDAFIFLRCDRISCWSCLAHLNLFPGSAEFLDQPANCSSSNRGENGELRVGVRRLMRQLNNMPSSVISSHSMHLGVLATASHAISTGTLFSVFYKPRFDPFYFKTSFLESFLYSRQYLLLAVLYFVHELTVLWSSIDFAVVVGGGFDAYPASHMRQFSLFTWVVSLFGRPYRIVDYLLLAGLVWEKNTVPDWKFTIVYEQANRPCVVWHVET